MKYKSWIIFTILTLFIFFLRFPSFFEPNWYGDEGIFAAVGQGILNGQTLYAQTWDNKPPLIYLLYAGVFKIFGPSQFFLRWLALISVLATAFLIFWTGRKFFNQQRAFGAALIFGFLSSIPFLEGNLALTEIFMIVFTAWAMFLFLGHGLKNEELEGRDRFLFIFLGLLLAISSLFKQVGGLEFGALLFFIIISQKQFFQKSLLLIIGFLLPYLLFGGYFFWQGNLGDFIFAAYTYYWIYLKESPKLPFYLLIIKLVPVVVVGIWLVYRRIRDEKIGMIFILPLWLAASFLGAMFSGRAYPHYLIQTLPALSLCLVSLKIPKKINHNLVFPLIIILAFLFVMKNIFQGVDWNRDFWRFSYYQNSYQFLMGQKNAHDYNNYFDREVNTILDLTAFLKNQRAEGKPVYIWGDYPWLYALSEVRNPVRYVTSFHVFGVPGGKQEVINQLKKDPPVLILLSKHSIGQFAELEVFLQNWKQVATIGQTSIFKQP